MIWHVLSYSLNSLLTKRPSIKYVTLGGVVGIWVDVTEHYMGVGRGIIAIVTFVVKKVSD